jgi:hypothetical protein
MNTEIEDIVIHFLYMMKETTPTFMVHCWYENVDVRQEDLSKFKTKYSEYLDKIEMSFYSLNSHEHAVWYDIINIKDESLLSHYKFRSTYKNPDDIISCILEFNSVIKFDTQKNIGYNKHGYNKDNKDAKDSDNRFKKVGRQTET